MGYWHITHHRQPILTFRSSLEQIVAFSDVRLKAHDDLFSEVGQIENEPLLDAALLDDEHVSPAAKSAALSPDTRATIASRSPSWLSIRFTR
jgi:hypothetical protein